MDDRALMITAGEVDPVNESPHQLDAAAGLCALGRVAMPQAGGIEPVPGVDHLDDAEVIGDAAT